MNLLPKVEFVSLKKGQLCLWDSRLCVFANYDFSTNMLRIRDMKGSFQLVEPHKVRAYKEGAADEMS